jgi:hypothetical protein
MDSIQELAGLVRSQQREMDELRAQSEIVAKMRTLVGEKG